MTKLPCLVLIVWLTLSGLAWSQASSPNTARDVQFEADQVDYDKTASLIRLVGKVKFQTPGAVLTSATAQYQIDKMIAEFLGGVKMVASQSTLTGKEMKVWYADSRGVVKGDVRVITQYSGRNPAATEEPTILTCSEVEYDWGLAKGVARGGVKMRQGVKRAFADRAEFDQERQQILLLGNVRFEEGNGDWLTASRMIYNTAEETVRAEGRVVAKTRLETKPEEAGAKEAPAKRTLPKPLLIEPDYQLLPMRELPTVPLPWLDKVKSVQQEIRP